MATDTTAASGAPAAGTAAAPPVSCVIPTLNSARLLERCLASLRAQVPGGPACEILVADGGSSDGTPDVARRFGATVLDAGGLLAEEAKKMAFSRARGTYVALLDADNEVVGTDWLRRALAALERHPDALGFESYYLKAPEHTRLNRYLTGCLQISDPCAWLVAGRPRLLAEEPDGCRVFRLPADGSYATGANGFLFRRELIGRLGGEAYHEAVFFPSLMRGGLRTLLKIPGCGVRHHYVTTWRDFFRKRQRAMIIYMLRAADSTATWDRGRAGSLRKLAALLYFGTVAGPALEGAARALAARDPDWLLHPAAGVVSTLGNALGVLRFRLRPDRAAQRSASKALHNRQHGSAPRGR